MPWLTTPEEAMRQTGDALQQRVKAIVRAVLLRYAIEIEASMKQEAPWIDRTGNLRQSLHAWVEEMADVFALSFDYGLTYGKFLEFSHEGRYAIISPTLDKYWPLILADLQKALGS